MMTSSVQQPLIQLQDGRIMQAPGPLLQTEDGRLVVAPGLGFSFFAFQIWQPLVQDPLSNWKMGDLLLLSLHLANRWINDFCSKSLIIITIIIIITRWIREAFPME